MREIKFRAWSKEYKEMYTQDFDDYVMPENFNLFNSGLDSNGNLFCGQNLKNGDYEDLILMQYTGLKDKNGKEIYEGDIITVFENVNGITKPWQNIVCFKSAAFCLYDPNCCEVCKDGYGITCTLLEGKYIGDLEVIGNIYENPELLK